jgi:hypothetical protein
MTDEELIARLREGATWDDDVAAADRIEALTEQLAAARQDAKFAEDELEMQEQEACMMKNDYIKLEKERDALEAKLAKMVEIGNKMAHSIEENYYLPNIAGEWRKVAAEIKGKSHD